MEELDQQSKGAKARRIQMDLVMLESDFKKNERMLEELKIDLVRSKKQKDRLEVDISEKDQRMKKIQSEQMFLQGEIKRVKHGLDLL